jgi:glycosyltransferase involved in cell wall biosynthesis
MITVYTIAYNEEMILPYFIKWYRERFPNCRIVIHDNESTDDTVKIALENNCEVITYCTNNKLSDITYLKIKNNCWKEAITDWVIVCDADEMINITEEALKKEELDKVTYIKTKGWNMVNMVENVVGYNYEFGRVSAPQYSKNVLFNKQYIKEVNYNAGCHTNNFVGVVKPSKNIYDLCHYRFPGEAYTIQRYQEFVKRLSEENIKRKEGDHYHSNKQQIKEQYKYMRNIVKTNSDKTFNWLIE